MSKINSIFEIFLIFFQKTLQIFKNRTFFIHKDIAGVVKQLFAARENKEVNAMELRVCVPFSKKRLAREMGIRFDKTDRCWYASPEQKESFLSACEEKQIPEPVAPKETEIHKEAVSAEEVRRSSLPIGESTLAIALNVYEHGMPTDEKERTRVLKRLGSRKPDEYPITYDGMMNCSEDFRRLYPASRVEELMQRCITGQAHYSEEIMRSDLTEEEKALLFLVLPITQERR